MTDNKHKHDMAYFFKSSRPSSGLWVPLYVKARQARGAGTYTACCSSTAGPYSNTDDDHPVRDAWGHGFVNVQGFSGDINNLGNYLCAYLTDDEATSKKGARLANYGPARLYNCSRGISRRASRACPGTITLST